MQTLAQHVVITPAIALVTCGGMIVVMTRIDPGLAVLLVAVAPCIAVASVVLGRPLHFLSRTRQDLEGSLVSHVHQTLSGLSIVQGFGQEDRQRRRFQEFAADAIRVNRRQAGATTMLGLAANGLATLGMAAILWLGGRHVLAGDLSVGEMLVFVAYLTSLQDQFRTLTEAYGSLQSARGSIDRVMEVLEVDDEVVDRPGAPSLAKVRGLIRLECVSFGYEPARAVLHDVSLEVRPGQTLALVGPTGAGKSTLVSLVPRFFDPWSGQVLVDGCDVRHVSVRSLRAQVALVLQEPFLFPLSVADNIAYGRPSATRAEIEAAARIANAHPFIERLPHRYDTLIGERGATLSGGERQRLAIARAVLKDAPILLLDEPTSALDPETESLLLEALERLMVGRTTLIIAHRLSTIRRADRIVVLDDGTIVESGTHKQLLTNNGRYARFYQSQFGSKTRRTPAANARMAHR
jgi:ATP-binding cassette subfamily B protein/subfamily B ATP-binding cassette protein MsbA